jgi:hypothetical protein
MENGFTIRWGWLRAMYIYTLVGAGGLGFGLIVFPAATKAMMGFPAQDPGVLGLYACVLLASGLIAILALRDPLKFVPLLLLQLVYKPLWLFVFAIPLFLKGQFPKYAVGTSVVFLTYIIGDLIAIPFAYLLSKKRRQ